VLDPASGGASAASESAIIEGLVIFLFLVDVIGGMGNWAFLCLRMSIISAAPRGKKRGDI
jgi:hypothetical protein